MKKYYVNKELRNGNHEVHNEDCRYLPSVRNKEYLGEFYHCSQAVNTARRRGYSNVDGCYHCSNECHHE